MSAKYEIPPRKRFLPWIVGLGVGLAVWQALLQLAHTSGAFAVYVAIIVGFNAFAIVAAGIAKPRGEEEEGFVLSPHNL